MNRYELEQLLDQHPEQKEAFNTAMDTLRDAISIEFPHFFKTVQYEVMVELFEKISTHDGYSVEQLDKFHENIDQYMDALSDEFKDVLLSSIPKK